MVSRLRGELCGNLPAETSSFIGRRRELAELKRLLMTGRLVTLTGVGGVGKTRLALRAAAKVVKAFEDGLWLVELAALRDDTLLAHAVVDSLGVQDSNPGSPQAALVRHLADKQLLLILDNCEHVATGCADLAEKLLTAAPGLRILATSRHVLRATGERVLVIRPMRVPDPGQLPSVSDVNKYDSIVLLTERARPVPRGFDVSSTSLATMARLCHRLDGIPLAIELAAVRSRALSLDEILQLLDDRFHLPAAVSRTAPPGDQTLETTIAWTYHLCSPAERLLWSRLSVFAGEFDLEAAKVVCASAGINADRVLSLVLDLAEKSILAVEDARGRTRYQMLDTIRDYGLRRLRATGDEATTRRRHRDYYQRLVARAEANWSALGHVAWYDRLRMEHANLRLALDFCLTEPGEKQPGLAMVTSLSKYWITGGALGESLHWLTRLLTLAEEPTPMRAKALWTVGWAAQLRGDVAGATAALDECRALAEELGCDSALAYATRYSASVAMRQGKHTDALGQYQDALTRFQRLGDKVGLAGTLAQMALCYCLRGDVEHDDVNHAIALSRQCLHMCAVSGWFLCHSYALYVYSLALWQKGRHREAKESARKCIQLKRVFDDASGIGKVLELLAWIAVAERQDEHATRLMGAAHRIWLSTGGPLVGIAQLHAYHDRAEQRARQNLGSPVFDRILKQSAEFSLDLAIDHALGHAGATPPVAGTRIDTQLTRREWQVAKLVAEGLSDKDIAARLRVARSTAEGHVERILTKLRFSKRTQLATWIRWQRNG